MCVCVYVCMYVYIYINIHTHTYIYIWICIFVSIYLYRCTQSTCSSKVADTGVRSEVRTVGWDACEERATCFSLRGLTLNPRTAGDIILYILYIIRHLQLEGRRNWRMI